MNDNKTVFKDWTLTTEYYNNEVVKCPVYGKSFFNGKVYIQDDKETFSYTCSFGANSESSYSGSFYSYGITSVTDAQRILDVLLKEKSHNTQNIPGIISKLKIHTLPFNTSVVLKEYKVCALWSSETDNEDLEGLTIFDFDPEFNYKMACNVLQFLTENEKELIEIGLPNEQIGHTLWLTQNRHGSGFFDFPMSKETEQKLTLSAQGFKECNLFVIEGKIYGE